MQPHNPYAPPTAAVADIVESRSAGDDRLIPNGRRRPALNGVEWIAASWRIFKEHPGKWILAVLLGYGLTVALSFIPFVNIVVTLLGPMLTAGFAAMAHATERNRPVSLTDLLAGFGDGPRRSLLVLGALYTGFWLATILVLVGMDGSKWAALIGTGNPEALTGNLPVLLGYMLMMTVVGLLVSLAPPLIVLNGLGATEALRMSAAGGLKNVLPGVVCALTFVPILFMSALPIGLGLLVSIPMLVISIYSAYRDIFLEPGANSSDAVS